MICVNKIQDVAMMLVGDNFAGDAKNLCDQVVPAAPSSNHLATANAVATMGEGLAPPSICRVETISGVVERPEKTKSAAERGSVAPDAMQ